MEVSKSVVLGNGTLKKPLAVSESVILGSDAGHKHSRGSENIFIGKAAGYSALGNQNIYIGANAGFSCEGSGNIFLGYGINIGEANNTLVIGNAITASLITGHTVIPSLDVLGNITFKGKLIGDTNPEGVKRYGTNVGNISEGVRVVSLGDYAGYGNTGQSVVALGAEAGYANTGHSVIAIGEHAAASNVGLNVIAIGNNAGMGNKQSEALFIGDFIEGTPNSLTLKRPVQVQGWNIKENVLSCSNIELTPDHLKLSKGTLSVSDAFHFSKPVSILGNTERAPFYYFTTDLSCVQIVGTSYFGLGGDGHVYTSKGKGWTPIRSPNLTSLSKTHNGVLVGYGSGSFVRYTSNGWIPETRDQGEYSNTFVAGSFAVGKPLQNEHYEDSGTLLTRIGTEWRLYPGKYPEEFTDVAEWNGEVYASGKKGFYHITERIAHPIYSEETSCIGTSSEELLIGNGNKLMKLETFSAVKWLSHLHTFQSPITRIFWDSPRWVVHTADGVYASPAWNRIHKACSFLTLKHTTEQSADLTVPTSVRLGKIHISEKNGLVLDDGTCSSRVYDTLFNPLPISFNGIKHINIEKDPSGQLCFNILSENDDYAQVRVSAL